ncbi:MAG: hypothetical protein NNA23_07245, partial [Nitrospira sp.]|nr:hypothetical protein [Nitrospira sp.]
SSSSLDALVQLVRHPEPNAKIVRCTINLRAIACSAGLSAAGAPSNCPLAWGQEGMLRRYSLWG